MTRTDVHDHVKESAYAPLQTFLRYFTSTDSCSTSVSFVA